MWMPEQRINNVQRRLRVRLELLATIAADRIGSGSSTESLPACAVSKLLIRYMHSGAFWPASES